MNFKAFRKAIRYYIYQEAEYGVLPIYRVHPREECSHCDGNGGWDRSKGRNEEHPDYYWVECSRCDGKGYLPIKFKCTGRLKFKESEIKGYDWKLCDYAMAFGHIQGLVKAALWSYELRLFGDKSADRLAHNVKRIDLECRIIQKIIHNWHNVQMERTKNAISALAAGPTTAR